MRVVIGLQQVNGNSRFIVLSAINKQRIIPFGTIGRDEQTQPT